mgnify:CR=1 FL=1
MERLSRSHAKNTLRSLCPPRRRHVQDDAAADAAIQQRASKVVYVFSRAGTNCRVHHADDISTRSTQQLQIQEDALDWNNAARPATPGSADASPLTGTTKKRGRSRAGYRRGHRFKRKPDPWASNMSPKPHVVGVNHDRLFLKLSIADANYLTPDPGGESSPPTRSWRSSSGNGSTSSWRPTTTSSALSAHCRRFKIDSLPPAARRSTCARTSTR